MITKTDYLAFLDAPMHLWASKHDQIEIGPSLYDQHLMHQGHEVEVLARDFLREHLHKDTDVEIQPEATFLDDKYQARVDLLARYPQENAIDVYEVKSSTSIKKKDQHDTAFQRFVCEASETVRNIYLVHLNKDYVRQGNLELSRLYVVENLNEKTNALRDDVFKSREIAWQLESEDNSEGIVTCGKPRECPCPALCHGNLPEHPIYDIPRLSRGKARELKGRGIYSIREVPGNYHLSDLQRRHVAAVQRGEPLFNARKIASELARLTYPVSYLDYETYSPGIPLFDRYKPYQHIVFQYSLHVLRNPESKLEHYELLLTDNKDPGPFLVDQLSRHLPESGSVVVWNKTFEAGRNAEMAERYPGNRDFLEDVNSRIYDLMEIFSKGLYVHPGFHGSASIKNVLPVMVPDFDQAYTDFPISNGEEAMLAWINITQGNIPEDEVDQFRKDMLAYCKLDTLAMVKIFRALCKIVL